MDLMDNPHLAEDGSAAGLRDYLDYIDQGICVFGPDFRLVIANKTFQQLLDYPEGMCRPGTHLMDFLKIDCARGLHGSQTPEEVFTQFRAELETAPAAVFETRLHNGRVIEYARRRTPNGAIVCTFTNITGIRRAAEALERDSSIIRHLSDAVAVTDLECRVLFHNPAFSRLFGISPRNQGEVPLPPMGFAHSSQSWAQFRQAMAEGIAAEGRYRFTLELGRRRPEELVIEGLIVPRRDTVGDHVGYLAIYRDVTEKAQISRRLLRQDRVISQLNEAVIIADINCIATDCNEAAERLLGYSRAELIGKHLPTMIYGDPLPGYPRPEDIHHTIQTLHRWSGEMLLKTKNGGHRLFDCNVQPFFDEQGRHIGYIGVHRDVTERRAAEEALRRQALVMEHLSEAVVVTNDKGEPEEYNACAEGVLGLGQATAPHAPVRSRLREIAATVLEKGRYEGVYELPLEDGRVRHIDAVAVPVTTRPGAAPSIVSVHRDITQRLREQEEQQRLRERMARWERLETLGRLAGGMAHDFNNVLTPIIGYAHLVLHQLDPDSAVAADMRKVIEGMETARELVRNVLTFGQRLETPRRAIRFDRTIETAVEMARTILPENVKISASYNCPGASILGNSTQLHQIVFNLFTNAAQAMPEGGEIRLVTDHDGEWDRHRRELDLPEGGHVRLVVEDTGSGIPPEVVEHIFEPFFTTKPKGKGTGLGLSVVHGIVRAHQGAITVDSTPGEGTRFEIFFPLAKAKDIGLSEKAEPIFAPEMGPARILVVDDDPDILDLASRILQLGGHEVITASGVKEALARYEQESCDLVLTDYAMGDGTGEELVRCLRKKGFGGPILVMSGHVDPQLIATHRQWGADGLLAKPLRHTELFTMIRQAFAQKGCQTRRRRVKGQQTGSNGKTKGSDAR
ncbi:MAG: PAS domain S-box protein [Alphaproteobacteria bacterium]|nr:MAG: PAS domain S-box protein [Alphaproteobacteria bacterium]